MSVRRSVAASFLASGWAALIGLAFVPLYIHYLGIESYALIGFFATLQVWLALLDMGLSATLNREMARFSAEPRDAQHVRDLLRSMEVICGSLALAAAMVIMAASPVIAAHWLNAQALPVPTVAAAVGLMGVVIAVQWLGSLYRSGLLGLHQQLWLSGATAFWATVRALGSVVVLALVAPTITAFFIFQIVVSLAEAASFKWRLEHCLPRAARPAEFSRASLAGVWRFAAGLSIAAVLATVLTQVDKLLLARLLPLDRFGYFMLMSVMAGALAIVTAPIHNVAYPRFASLVAAADQRTLVSEYHKFAQLLAVLVLPPGLMLAIFPADIIRLWTHDETATQAVAPLLPVWVAGTLLNAAMHVPYMAQLAHGWTRLSVAANAVAVLVMVPALLLLVPRHGAMAAAWIWVAINAGYVVLSIPVMHQRILRGEAARWYLLDLVLPSLAGLVTALAFKFSLRPDSGTLGFAALLVTGLAVLAATMLGASHGREAIAGAWQRMKTI